MSVAEHIVSSEKREFEGSLVFPRQIASWHGRDISKKATSRSRNRRYLYVLPGALAFREPGRLGSLKDPTDDHPLLYIEFPQGRLRLRGTVHRVRAPYISLAKKTEKQDSITCEDVFHSVVVFGDYRWIGTAQENPTEKALPIPDAIIAPPAEAAAHFTRTRGGGGKVASAPAPASSSSAAAAAAPAEQSKSTRSSGRCTSRTSYAELASSDGDDDIEADGAGGGADALWDADDDENEDESEVVEVAQPKARVVSKGKRKAAQATDDESESEHEEDGGDEVEAVGQRQKRARGAKRSISYAGLDDGGDDDVDDDGEAAPLSDGDDSQSPVKRRKSESKTAPIILVSDDED